MRSNLLHVSVVLSELYPIRYAGSTGYIEGTATRRLESRRPTYWEWIGAPVMQQFEFEANYAVSQFAYHHGGRLAILPGPCHFLDMDKIRMSSVFETFNRDILKYGSELVTDHWLKLYVMAEDRHLSTLYATKTKYKTAWVSQAYFYYKPEKTWIDMLQQRIRWQGGTLVSSDLLSFFSSRNYSKSCLTFYLLFFRHNITWLFSAHPRSFWAINPGLGGTPA